MELINNVNEELWNAIEKSYKEEKYTGAILDAMHFLTEIIKNKSGLDIEGPKLAVEAFGGDNPKIRVNNLQTASEKDTQKGIEEIIKGIYIAVRNSRSYNSETDSKEVCNSIVIFVNYLLEVIHKSKVSFQENTFLLRVFDEYYVPSKEYSDLLVSEIPKDQRGNIAISVLLKRKKGKTENLASFMKSLIEVLEEDDVARVYSVVSEELKYTNDEEEIKSIISILPGEYWVNTDKAVKIRIENILLASVKVGRYNKAADRCIGDAGALGTWINEDYLRNFEDLGKWTKAIIMKLAEGSIEEQDYIYNYFWNEICELNRVNINSYLKDYISQGLTRGYYDVAERFYEVVNKDKYHPWFNVFKNEIAEYESKLAEEEVEDSKTDIDLELE